jgi:hypothetical protein
VTWYRKEQPTPFDEQPLEGLYYLNGDILAAKLHQPWMRGKKFALIAFPSGEERPIWEGRKPGQSPIVHLFGELDLPYFATPEEALRKAVSIAEACGYAVRKRDDRGMEVLGHAPNEYLLITYDAQKNQMQDVVPLPAEQWEAPVHPAHQLMTDEIRQQFPPLYANEQIGLEAIAPVKYFSPDSNWTWYPTEFDGEDLFFGLVIGYEIELGYFSLSELQNLRGPLGLRIERDLYYKPKTLQELQTQHHRERGKQ